MGPVGVGELLVLAQCVEQVPLVPDQCAVEQFAPAELRTIIRDEIFGRMLWVDPNPIYVAVTDGVVTMRGELERQSEVEIAEHLVRVLPGVVDVHNQLKCGWNDTTHTRQTEIFG